MMREELRKQCEIFLENRDVVKETFKWEISLLFPVCASVFTNKGQVATKEKLQQKVLEQQLLHVQQVIKKHILVKSQ